jgi:Zinc dependent phospholipase C
MRPKSRIPGILLTLALFLAACRPVFAYSLLTHEQLIDLTWKDSIVPLLLSHYPGLTPQQLDEARAYAYGGCVIQDIGYYPFGDASFSNLTHYVRSGDFVVNLFRNAHNADELAFAIGALSHYVGDSIGHSEATNLAVPVEFPELRAKFGPQVNYAEGKHQHVQTEFAFDINEIAHHRVAPLRYLRHIGLQVPVKQLALAFYQTYGLTEDFSTARRSRFNVSDYHFATRSFIPRIAYALTLLHRSHEPADLNTPEAVEIHKQAAQVAAEDNWDHYRGKAGIGTYTLAGLIFILPKVGPLKMVAVKGPTADTEAEYMRSVARSQTILHHLLARLTPPSDSTPTIHASLNPTSSSSPAQSTTSTVDDLVSHDPRHTLPNRDLDTGRVIQPGGYPLTDSTYADLLHRITRQPDQPIPPGIKQDIEAYYSDSSSPITTKKDTAAWDQVQADLATLAKMPTSTEPEPYPTYGDDAAASQ